MLVQYFLTKFEFCNASRPFKADARVSIVGHGLIRREMGRADQGFAKEDGPVLNMACKAD